MVNLIVWEVEHCGPRNTDFITTLYIQARSLVSLYFIKLPLIEHLVCASSMLFASQVTSLTHHTQYCKVGSVIRILINTKVT